MKRIHLLIVIIAGTLTVMSATATEPFLQDLPPGVYVQKSFIVPEARTAELAKKLGGGIERISNSALKVQGRVIQVNSVTATDESSAKTIHQKIGKPFPFSFRKGRTVIEYVGKSSDAPLALKTSYELGLLEKPDRLNYTYAAELATVDQADYMSCNSLFNEFLKLNNGDTSAQTRIEELAGGFSFGHSLTLRVPNETARYRFASQVSKKLEKGPVVTYSFENLSARFGIPYVSVRLDGITTSDAFMDAASSPSAIATAATAHWPADSLRFKDLAEKLTKGKSTNKEKAQAILKWLQPGTNLKSSGQRGSRWGSAQVLEQGFGHCWDFSDVFITLCRAADVPSRQIAGWLYGTSGHVWAEYYIEGKGWQQVDPTGGGILKCGIYHIPLFTSEDGEMPIVYLAMPRIKSEQEDTANPAKKDG